MLFLKWHRLIQIDDSFLVLLDDDFRLSILSEILNLVEHVVVFFFCLIVYFLLGVLLICGETWVV